MAGQLNGKHAYVVGAVVLALLTVFALLNGVPWVAKAEFSEFKRDIKESLMEIKGDLKGLRIYMERTNFRRERGD